ncbi:hypothetical protein Syun_023959 [Stephania yunnanensis]|uniref:Cytochrome P450 n=1 Tax=Stephania yunnanensis TaxID=152371 RepID=A0AAP0FPJ6_9MAGN
MAMTMMTMTMPGFPPLSVVGLVFPSLLLLLFFLHRLISSIGNKTSKQPLKCYPLVASSIDIYRNRHRRNQWLSELLLQSPTATFVLQRPLGLRQVFTANPANVRHILKSHFHLYPKGLYLHTALSDFLGSGIFNSDGPHWKSLRQISSHEFNTKSLRTFVHSVVRSELSLRLLPILSSAASSSNSTLDLQDLLQRFAFDNICNITFGHDPRCLLPSLPNTLFASSFDDAVRISSERFNCVLPLFWKTKRFLNVGSERRLKKAISLVRDFARTIVKQKKKEFINLTNTNHPNNANNAAAQDLLSRLILSNNNGGEDDETLGVDMVISFILAGRDTTSAALTWFFWLVSRNPRVEAEILKEIKGIEEEGSRDDGGMMVYEEVRREMGYTEAALCESMRLYPPVPTDTKEAAEDDVLPDGTEVRKGTRVAYHPYTMGRMERDPYEYPVFQAGPRVCLGKDMAMLQMKSVVAGVMRRFRVVPVLAEGAEPVFIADLTAKMKGGFPVRIEARE